MQGNREYHCTTRNPWYSLGLLSEQVSGKDKTDTARKGSKEGSNNGMSGAALTEGELNKQVLLGLMGR